MTPTRRGFVAALAVIPALLVSNQRPLAEPVGKTGIAIRYVKDYTIVPDPAPMRVDWFMTTADLSARVQSGRERLGE